MKSQDEEIEMLEKEIMALNDLLEDSGALNLSFVDQVGISRDRDMLRQRIAKLKAEKEGRVHDLL